MEYFGNTKYSAFDRQSLDMLKRKSDKYFETLDKSLKQVRLIANGAEGKVIADVQVCGYTAKELIRVWSNKPEIISITNKLAAHGW